MYTTIYLKKYPKSRPCSSHSYVTFETKYSEEVIAELKRVIEEQSKHFEEMGDTFQRSVTFGMFGSKLNPPRIHVSGRFYVKPDAVSYLVSYLVPDVV